MKSNENQWSLKLDSIGSRPTDLKNIFHFIHQLYGKINSLSILQYNTKQRPQQWRTLKQPKSIELW